MEKRRALWFAIPLVLIVTMFALFACCCPGKRPATALIAPIPVPLIGEVDAPVPIEAVPAAATDVQMRNVDFRVDPNLVLHIHDLRGQMLDKEAGKPLNFDNKKSFVVRLFNGHIGVDPQTLTNLLNGYVFNYEGTPLKNLAASVAGGQLVLEGTMHKVIDIPFRMISDVSATKEGWMRIHPAKIEICNLNGEGLMKAFGITLQKVLTKLPAGVKVEKNDMLIDPLAILPPPKIEGHLGAVAIEGGELVQIFDDGRGIPPLQPPDTTPKNFMYLQHGTLRMGKLFMVSADMEVIDTDPSDPFDFYIDRYNLQLVAGYDRNQLNYGLIVHMRDASDVGKPPRPDEHLVP